MKRMGTITLILLTSLLSINKIKAQRITQDKLEIVDSIFMAHFDSKSPGGAFAIVYKGETIYRKMEGLANLEHRIPITDSTVFNIASNSKQLTTLVGLILEAEGKLNFDADIKKYLPELNHLEHKITIRQLTNHTHGLPNSDELAQLRSEVRMTHQQVLEMLLDIEEFNFKPGDNYQYNNTGYILLSEIISRLEEKPFAQVLYERVLKPIGMNASYAVSDYNEIISNKAYSYSASENGFKKNPVKLSTVGSAGLYSSINDLILWTKNFIAPDNPFEHYLKEMQAHTVLNSGKLIEYGLGLQFEKYKGIDIVFHGGGTAGYRSYILHAPQYELSLVFISNAGGFTGLDVTYPTLDILLSDQLDIVELKEQKMPLDKCGGEYELFPGSFYSILSENDSLFWQSFGTSEKLYLPQIGINTFNFPALQHARLTFYTDHFELRYGDFTYPAARIKAPDESINNYHLGQYDGTFVNTTHNKKYTLKVIDNHLAVNPDGENVRLYSYAKDSFYAYNSFIGTIDFIKDENGTISAFKFSRQNIGNLTFTKVNDCN